MLQRKFYAKPEDCQWIRETALKAVNASGRPIPPFRSFVLEGNEDCPFLIVLYREAEPTINSAPVAYFTCDGQRADV